MADNEYQSVDNHKSSKSMNGGVSSGIYGMAFIGALVYYIAHALTFWAGVLGVIKAIFWPAFLVYNLLEFLKM
jgi:hypothetical protein